jgi:ferric-dicitrate binding protein FerR (iron transport regulator)
VAAAALVGAVVLLVVRNGSIAPEVVATVERVQGAVQMTNADGDSIAQVGGALIAGGIVTTSSGQVALRLVGGGSLRLAAGAELRLNAANEAELVAGMLYFDSETEAARERLTVLTSLGTVRDVGTQFSARLANDALEVGVRDGRVAVARGPDTAVAGSGERLTVAPGAGDFRREPIPTFGDEWAWADRLAPPFDIDGRNLIDFLSWVAEQTGRELAFSDPAAERIARQTVMSGSIDLEPERKLAAVLATTELGYAIEGERIVISAR